ncbi:MAG: hypothetical protein OXF88_10500 [Rhodobacteraceae bacterium]|nr:hypothetical protein [Paracoccaceae bacterium]MCY4141914.1 hypothetical protein [Paracoccaceae bacterium]
MNNPGSKRQSSPYFDEVVVHGNDTTGVIAAHDWIVCVDAIERALPKTFPLEEIEAVTAPIDVLRAEIAELSGQYRQMLAGLAEERAKFRKEADAQRAAAQQEYDAEKVRRTEYENNQRKEFDAYKAEVEADLQGRREDLDQLKQDLDDRQHMHARRDLRGKISEDFKARGSRPVVSKLALMLRLLIFVLTLTIGIGIGTFAFESFGDVLTVGSASDTPVWLAISYVIRSIVLVALAVGFVAYAINWLRVNYLDDVRTERRYEKYGHDIDRASFVIETIMDVGKQENMQVPDAWVDGVCRNLFHDRTDRDPDASSSNALAALFEIIAGAKFGPEGTEVTVDRRGARKFSKKFTDT